MSEQITPTTEVAGASDEIAKFHGKVSENPSDVQMTDEDEFAALAKNPKENIDTTESLITIKSANAWSEDAATRPDPKPLWKSLWYEGEVAILFADSNLGKSVYAVAIGNEIAKTGRKVLYFDFELSDKQFQRRYTDPTTKKRHQFPPTFLRGEINPNAIIRGSIEDALMSEIRNQAISCGSDVLIIDNLTYLCNTSEKGDAAGILMQNLMHLKRVYGWSILAIAHTPKRSQISPLTQNDLAGSKKIFNFCDAVFAIGRSARDENLKYIKQLKVRSGSFEYNADNVITGKATGD